MRVRGDKESRSHLGNLSDIRYNSVRSAVVTTQWCAGFALAVVFVFLWHFKALRGNVLSIILSGNETSSPLIALTHGVTDNAASLAALVSELNPRFRVAAIDLLGHGLSPRLTPEQLEHPFAAQAQALEETYAQLARWSGRPVIAIAHSMGAALTSYVAARCPELFAGLVLEEPAWLDSAGRARYRAAGPQAAKRAEWIARNMDQALAELAREHPAWSTAERAGWAQAKVQVDTEFVGTGIVTFDEPWELIAQKLTMPTLVISSDDADVLLGPGGLEEIHAAAPHLEVCLIPGARHEVRRDQGAAYSGVVGKFLRETVRKGAKNLAEAKGARCGTQKVHG